MATTAQEIALMKHRIKSMEDKLDSLDDKLDTLAKKLLDPDNGFVVRVNRNTEFRELYDRSMLNVIDEFKELQRWKRTVSKALWGLYAAIIGCIIKLIFL
jgi:predicted  nucleic acid-binding Zn-ribbon protein